MSASEIASYDATLFAAVRRPRVNEGGTVTVPVTVLVGMSDGRYA